MEKQIVHRKERKRELWLKAKDEKRKLTAKTQRTLATDLH
jgi:hypothetical protein